MKVFNYSKARKGYSKYKKRKAWKRQSAPAVSGSSNPLPFANTKTVTLKYSDLTLAISTLGTIQTYIYRLNSPYDPDQTGIGHSSRGFDEYMNLYERYEVISAKATCVFSNRDQQYAHQAAMSVQSGVSTPTLINDYIEGANGKTTFLGAENNIWGVKQMSLKCNIAKYLGVKKFDPDLQGTSGTNPSQIAYLHVAVQPIQGVTPAGIDIQTDLEMKVKFSHPKKLLQS